MTIEEGIKLIEACADQMNDRYGQVVFDEFAIISLAQNKGRVVAYVGPRNETFLKNFTKDLGSLRAALLDPNYNIGDFEFSRHGVGTTFEAFMVLGKGIYLVCNNTVSSMEQIAKNPKWLNAQIPFAELSEKVRANPVTA
jgi:hypothetical protein